MPPRKTAASKAAESNGASGTALAEPIELAGVSNSGVNTILMDEPYVVEVEVTGSSAILFHRWQTEAVEAKARAAKGSDAKKTDDVESYVYRNDEGQICLPGEYLRGTLIDVRNGAAKYLQDPRSPRKSALDLFRGGIVSLTELAPITTADGRPAMDWDYLDARRVVVQRSGITRQRPAFREGWKATVILMVQSPEHIKPSLLHQTLNKAGMLVGLADFRPSFGRFNVTRFEKIGADQV